MSNKNTFNRNLIRNQFQPETSQKQMVVFFVMMLLFAGFVLFTSLSNKPQYILPPEPNAENQTFDMVLSFIKSDNTDTIPYGEGFNCVDSVFRVWRNAEWQGIVARPIVIQYEEPPGHMVIGFSTVDRGVVFFETQNDQQIRPIVGQNHNGRKVRGFYYMGSIWVPLVNSPEYDPSIVIK